MPYVQCDPSLMGRRSKEDRAIPSGKSMERVMMMRLSDAWATEYRRPKTIITSPGHAIVGRVGWTGAACSTVRRGFTSRNQVHNPFAVNKILLKIVMLCLSLNY